MNLTEYFKYNSKVYRLYYFNSKTLDIVTAESS